MRKTTRPQFKKLAEDILGKKVIKVHKITKGGDSKTFEIQTSDKNYILRTSGKRNNYVVEHTILEILYSKGIAVAKPLAASSNTSKYGFTYSLQEKLPGNDLEGLNRKHWPKILFEVGKELKKIYTIKTNNFGLIRVKKHNGKELLNGTHTTNLKFIDEKDQFLFPKIKVKVALEIKRNFKKTKLNKSQISKLVIIHNNLDHIRDLSLKHLENHNPKPVLLHGDLSAWHFLVYKNKLSGIIDFNKTIAGDPLYDIAYFSVMPGGNLYDYLLSSSGVDFDEKVFRIYRLLISTFKVHTRLIEFNYLHKDPEVLDIAIQELKYFS